MQLSDIVRRRTEAGGPDQALPLSELWLRAQRLATLYPATAAPVRRQQRALLRGLHAQRQAGDGDAFWQFRPHDPGEPASSIDWRRSARSEQLYVRQQEREVSRSIWLWVDRSASMHFRSDPRADSKYERAMLLGLAAAKLLADAGEKIALLNAHDRASGGHYGLNRLLAAFESEPTVTDGPAFPDMHGLPRHSRLLLVGDFLDDEASIRAALDLAIALGGDGHMLQIIDPAEEDFPYKGRSRFEGLEGEAAILLDRADDLRSAYRRRMAAHGAMLRDIAGHAGWGCSRHRTDHGAGAALLSLMALTGPIGGRHR